MPRNIEEPRPRRARTVPPPGTEAGSRASAVPGQDTTLADRPASGALPMPSRGPREPVRARVNIGDVERTLSVAGGGLLALYGLTRRSWTGKLSLAGLGGLLLYRGARGHSYVYERLGVERAKAPIEIVQAITINRPVEDVYGFWRKLENLPRFMRHLESVKELSPTRSHWVARSLGAGRALEWESDITEDRPNERIRWRAVPDGSIQHSGEVRFRPAPGGRGTEVHVSMEYRPPVGTALGAAAYPFTRQTLKEEIRRLKRVLEAGEIPTTEGQPSGRARKEPAAREGARS